MKIVMKYERKRGKEPRDVSRTKCGYDIKSGTRCIEVKGKGQDGKPPQWINLYKKVISKLGKNIMKYYIYVVYDVNKNKGKPQLVIIPPKIVLSNLEVDTNFILHPKRILKKYKEIKPIPV